MTTALFHCPCGHICPVPKILVGKRATCPGCDQPSGSGGFAYSTPANAEHCNPETLD